MDLHDGDSSNDNEPTEDFSGRDELARYKALRAAAKTSNSLSLQQNAKDFRLLPKLPNGSFAFPASSAQSESDLSSAGLTITDGRSRLSAKKVAALEIVRKGHRRGVPTTYSSQATSCSKFFLWVSSVANSV